MSDLPPIVALGLLLAGAAGVIGLALARTSGARLSLGRRLAGAREHRVGDLLDLDPLPIRPVRVVGRIRCPDAIVTAADDRLVALHRDVEVLLPDGSWRSIERIRESRGFELWDHDGSLTIDAADAAEPLVSIPHVWRGRADELGDARHRSAIERLTQEGHTPSEARSVTRMISVVERLLVLAQVERAGAEVRLVPPPGGYVISDLELPDAMRLLGGPGRWRLLVGIALLIAGVILAAASLLGWLLIG